MKTRKILAALIAILAFGQSAWAAENGWTIQASTSGSVTTFTISRTNTAVAETVKYRFVNLSAYAGQHYNVTQVNGANSSALTGEFTFAAGETGSRTIQVTESAGSGAYSYYKDNTQRSYKLELTDAGGFYLTSNTRSFTTGTSINSSNVYAETSVTVNSGTITVTDDNYAQAYHAVPVETYFSSAAPQNYLVAAGAELRMTLTFQAKEVNDGYQHLQILVNHPEQSGVTNWDEGSGDNKPGTMNYSSYMATFCHQGGSANTSYANYSFPVTSVGDRTYDSKNLLYAWTSLGNSIGDLRNQKFNTNCRADDGRLVISTKANLNSFSTLGIRFDASGDNEDTWNAYNTIAHIQAVDGTAPTVLGISVAPGKHAKGNTVYVTVEFSEIVTGTSSKLTSNWGDLSYVAGSGTNVLTFSRTIPASASSALSITGYSGITDLAGNAPSSVSDSNVCSLDDSYAYTITYDLDGGTLATENPTTYTYETAVTINNQPILAAGGYVFAGWTGSNSNTPQTTVTIPAGSHGNKSYTANWTPLWGQDSGATGEDEAHPYIISSTAGLDMLAKVVNGTNRYNANDFYGKFFKLANDITYTHTTDWDNANSTENNYTAIGRQSGITYFFFKGTFDGDNHTISGIRIYKGGNNNADSYQGLFGCVGASGTVKGTVKNVTLSDTRIAGYTAVGTISGENNGDVINCHAAATVVISAVSNYPANYHGGIVGQNGKGGTILNCTSAARLTSNFQSTWYYGAIAGQNAGTGSVINCLAVGASIPSMEKNYGVIVGYNNGGTLTNNYYRNCTVGDTANATNVGVGNSTNAPADQDGARSVHELALPTGVTATGESVEISSSTYYAAGTTVTLSYSNLPDGGSVIYKVNGTAIDGSSFTMPAGDVTVTAQLLNTVSYIDADGNEQTHACIPLVSSNEPFAYYGTSGQTNWYVVSGDVTFAGQLRFLNEESHIILCDGAHLTATAPTANEDAIYVSEGRITIYGQAQGTGTVTASGGTASSGIGAVSSVTINGGTINATGVNGVYSPMNNITINGGTVNAIGEYAGIASNSYYVHILGGRVIAIGNEFGIYAGNSITLGCRSASDRIMASSYFVVPENGCKVKVQDGQTLTDGTATYTGTLNADQIAAIAGKTMTPYVAPSPDLTLVQGTKGDVTAYWGTFYDSGSGYTLPAGAAAYTMDAEYHLYRLGTDGSVIPKGTAVVIMADQATISLTTSDNAQATDNAPGGNILVGRDVATSFNSFICVLGVNASGAVGFYPLSGIALPAHKAGYIFSDGLGLDGSGGSKNVEDRESNGSWGNGEWL